MFTTFLLANAHQKWLSLAENLTHYWKTRWLQQLYFPLENSVNHLLPLSSSSVLHFDQQMCFVKVDLQSALGVLLDTLHSLQARIRQDFAWLKYLLSLCSSSGNRKQRDVLLCRGHGIMFTSSICTFVKTKLLLSLPEVCFTVGKESLPKWSDFLQERRVAIVCSWHRKNCPVLFCFFISHSFLFILSSFHIFAAHSRSFTSLLNCTPSSPGQAKSFTSKTNIFHQSDQLPKFWWYLWQILNLIANASLGLRSSNKAIICEPVVREWAIIIWLVMSDSAHYTLREYGCEGSARENLLVDGEGLLSSRDRPLPPMRFAGQIIILQWEGLNFLCHHLLHNFSSWSIIARKLEVEVLTEYLLWLSSSCHSFFCSFCSLRLHKQWYMQTPDHSGNYLWVASWPATSNKSATVLDTFRQSSHTTLEMRGGDIRTVEPRSGKTSSSPPLIKRVCENYHLAWWWSLRFFQKDHQTFPVHVFTSVEVSCH